MTLERELKPRLRQSEPHELERLSRLYAGDKQVQTLVSKELSRRKWRKSDKNPLKPYAE
jgi:hypothetical protein